MTDKEVMQMALDALETHAKQYPHMVKGYTVDATEALRAALAQPEKEWQGLPNDEVLERANKFRDPEMYLRGVLWAEAKLKEKNT
jgi:hypothetical protein